jgi:hypothetical protein
VSEVIAANRLLPIQLRQPTPALFRSTCQIGDETTFTSKETYLLLNGIEVSAQFLAYASG